jgi:hypothetical protein
MSKTMKLTTFLVNKHFLKKQKGKYDPETRLLEFKRWRQPYPETYEVDPDHIYVNKKSLRIETVVFLDVSQRGSVSIKNSSVPTEGKSGEIHGEGDIDQKKRNKMNCLIKKAHWEAKIGKRIIPLSTTLLTLAAGMGVYHLIVLIARAFGLHV